MIRHLLRILLLKPVLWASHKFSSIPIRKRIFESLNALAKDIHENPGNKGIIIPFDLIEGKFIILSDQHKGRRNGADDFIMAEPNYLAALEYYNQKEFYYINLGDSEELWENNIWQVTASNKDTFEAERKFLLREKFIKVSGNHDLYWNTSPWAYWHLKSIYGQALKVYESVLLQTTINSHPYSKAAPFSIFLPHGHQGDAQSDGNWLSKFFVGWIWAPLQSLLRINPNTPAYNQEKKTLHNDIMYEWSSEQKNMLLVTGHTHQPVFQSLTLLEKLYKQFQLAGTEKNKAQTEALLNEIKVRENEFSAVSVDYLTMKPSYFNTGCCCFSDGDITGIEIENGFIRLIKWSAAKGRVILEERKLEEIAVELCQ